MLLSDHRASLTRLITSRISTLHLLLDALVPVDVVEEREAAEGDLGLGEAARSHRLGVFISLDGVLRHVGIRTSGSTILIGTWPSRRALSIRRILFLLVATCFLEPRVGRLVLDVQVGVFYCHDIHVLPDTNGHESK